MTDETARLRARVAELEALVAEQSVELRAREEQMDELRATRGALEGDMDVRQALELLEAANMKLTQANHRMKRHLRAAAKVQQALLPERMPQAENLRFAWRYRPCEGLAGDILNIFRLDDNHVGLYVLDVAGHGTAAALHAVSISRLLVPMSLRSSWVREWDAQRSVYYIVPPGEVADRLNRHFPWDEEHGQFFTLVYGVLDKRTLELRYCVAGHPGPVRFPAAGAPEVMQGTGLPIGLMPRAYDEQSLQLRAGERLYLYSDGITDVRTPSGELFGMERLLQSLDRARGVSLEASLDQLLQELETWNEHTSFPDDLSLLAIEVKQGK